MNETTFADRLKALLERDNMSYRDLEEKTGITTVTISRVLNGDRPLSAPNIVKIANAFGIDVRYFFCEEEEKDMYLKKDGKETTNNEELKQAIRDTGDKPEQVLVNMKAMCLDFIIDEVKKGYDPEMVTGLVVDIIGRLTEAVAEVE